MTLVKLNVTYAINHYSCPDQINRFEGKRASGKSFTAVCLKSPATRFNLIYFFSYRRVDFPILTPCFFVLWLFMYDSTSIPLPSPICRARDRGRKMATGQTASKEKDELDTPSFLHRYSVQKKSYFTRVFSIQEFRLYTISRNTLGDTSPILTKSEKDSYLIVKNCVSFKLSEIYVLEIKFQLSIYIFKVIKIISFLEFLNSFSLAKWYFLAVPIIGTMQVSCITWETVCWTDPHKDAGKLCLLRYDENQ